MLLSRTTPSIRSSHDEKEDEDEGGELTEVSLAAPPSPRQQVSTNSMPLRKFLVVLLAGSILVQVSFLFPSTALIWDDISAVGSPVLPPQLADQRQMTMATPMSTHPDGMTPPPADNEPSDEKEASEGTLIPRRLIFTYKWNVLERQTPQHFYENVQKTIQGYTDYWKQQDMNLSSTSSSTPVVVSFLNDTSCEVLIQKVAPELVRHFQEEAMGSYRSDMCRLAALYLHGGYYFDIDMELVQPMVAPPNTTFLTVKEANPNGYFFQSFLATTPRHPVIHRTLHATLPDFYADRRHNSAAPHVWMGPYTLHQAYHQHVLVLPNNTDEDPFTTNSLLLSEVNLEDHPRSSYPTVQRRRHGHGCCCNYVVEHDRTVYFYSRMVGAGPHCDM